VVSQLEGSDKDLYHYLDALTSADYEASKKFHGILILLYADFNRAKLMPFLKRSDHYPLAEVRTAKQS